MNRAIKLGAYAVIAWVLLLGAAFVLLGLAGCAHPAPPPVPPQTFVLAWGNPNALPACATPLVFPCILSQMVTGGTLSDTIAVSGVQVAGAAGTKYQVVINAYDPSGKLVSSKPATVTLP